MAASTTLYLTKEEAKVFASFSEELREGWTVAEEKGTAYESPDVLKMRAEMSRLGKHAELQPLFEALQKGSWEAITLPKVSDTVLLEFFFTIGAQGMTAFIRSLLPRIRNDEDVEGVVHLSELRHTMLQTNAAISYA